MNIFNNTFCITSNNGLFLHICQLCKFIGKSFQPQIQWNQFVNVSKIMPELMRTFTHFYKMAFCVQLVDPSNPLIPSYWNVQRYPLIHFQWNHFGHSSYDQRYPIKVNFIFLEHIYSCLVVLLIMVVFDDSWRSRRNAQSWTRDIWRPRRFCLNRQAALWPWWTILHHNSIFVASLSAWYTLNGNLARLASVAYSIDTCIVHDSTPA